MIIMGRVVIVSAIHSGYRAKIETLRIHHYHRLQLWDVGDLRRVLQGVPVNAVVALHERTVGLEDRDALVDVFRYMDSSVGGEGEVDWEAKLAIGLAQTPELVLLGVGGRVEGDDP
ncbi:MAG: hypothetical protein CL928_02825 [Deltaproteobacteria bacterium]|nr:hypothetical protein [Deltaproteobacteria bacterium]